VIGLWRRFVEACSAREDGTAFAIFRIALAAVILVDALGALQPGVLLPLFEPVSEGGLAVGKTVLPLWDLLGGPSTAGVVGLTWVAVAASAALLVGFGGRFTALVLLQVLLAVKGLPNDIGGGYDRLISNGLWLLVLGDGCATLSADCRRRTGAWTSERLVHAFPRHLAVFQLVMLYVSTGLWKQGDAWDTSYEAVYRTMLMTAYVRGNWWWVGYFAPLLKVATVLSRWWEILFWIAGVWHMARQGWLGTRLGGWTKWDLRWPFLGIGVVMHGVLIVFMNLGPFSLVTWCFYLLWLSPDEWRAIGARVWRSGSIRGSAPTGGTL